MITGLTHVTLQSRIAEGLRLGAELGFAEEFVDRVALPADFEGLGDAGESRLPLAMQSAPEGIRFEVVEHGRPAERTGAYTPLFAGPPPLAATRLERPRMRELLRLALLLAEPVAVRFEQCRAEAWCDAAGARVGICGLAVRAADLAAESEFWSKLLRVRWRGRTPDAMWGTIPSLVSASSELLLVHDPEATGVHAMNDRGFPSIGVYSTAIDADYERVLGLGARPVAAPIGTMVGGRAVRMALVVSPAGAPVELLTVLAPAERGAESVQRKGV